jgi:hypothetical protein
MNFLLFIFVYLCLCFFVFVHLCCLSIQAGASAQGVGALHIAANQGHLQITQLLVEGGAAVNAIDKNGDTPLTAGMYVSICM